MLEAPLTEEELTNVVQALAKGKSPGPDGLPAEFFQSYWSFMSDNFTRMVNESLASEGLVSKWGNKRTICITIQRRGPLEVNKLVINHIPQHHLQDFCQSPTTMAPTTISRGNSDQIAFLPLRFILDNILLTHESIQWAKESRQESIFLKLDFSKAYDIVDWAFMFQITEKLGMPNTFIHVIRMLFHDAMVPININNQTTTPFELHRGVRHGCPLAPYLFIITTEALKTTIKTCNGSR
jgi:hypothetical protein